MIKWEDATAAEIESWRLIAEQSLLGFIWVFFQLLQGHDFRLNWHHRLFARALERVYHGYTKRLIINCPPGAGKTEFVSINFSAWCVMQGIRNNHPTRWLPISYSDDLVRDNAGRVREILRSEPFQTWWPLIESPDIKAKADWQYLDDNKNRHRMFGTSLMGQLTGRRAGYLREGFTGALLNDDPQPPRDENAPKRMQGANKALNSIVRSRLAHDNVPIVLIQQRLGKADATAFLMSDKSPDKYERVVIPALVDKEYIDSLPEDIREHCIRDTGFTGEPCSYWPDKEPTEALLAIKEADPYLFYSQYQQDPDDAYAEGVIFRKEYDKMVKDGRLGPLPIDPRLPVNTYWDLGGKGSKGAGGNMVALLSQPFGQEERFIGEIANNDVMGAGFAPMIRALKLWAQENEVMLDGEHVGPHDLATEDIGTGNSRQDTAASMGLEFRIIPRVKDKADSLEAASNFFPRVRVDNKRCPRLAEAMRKYRRRWDEINEVYGDIIHDWTSHFMDAFQQAGLAWEEDSEEDTPPPPPPGGDSESWMGR